LYFTIEVKIEKESLYIWYIYVNLIEPEKRFILLLSVCLVNLLVRIQNLKYHG